MSDIDKTDEPRRQMALMREKVRLAGIDEAMIERLVRGFYGKIREDDLIGPIFAARIQDWEPHLQKMFAFWSSVMLLSSRYEGFPMRVHLPLPIGSPHFDRWLKLFGETARETCPPEAAQLFIERAEQIGENFEFGIATFRGESIIPRSKRKKE